MGYRLMLGVARHCLLYSGRSNKSVSYRRGKAPRPTLRILIFKTPLVCTSIGGDRSSSAQRHEKFGGESATAWRKTTWTIWRESNDRVTNTGGGGGTLKIATDRRTNEIRNEICLRSGIHRAAGNMGRKFIMANDLFYALAFVKIIIAIFVRTVVFSPFNNGGCLISWRNVSTSTRRAILGCRQFPRHFMLRSCTWNVSQVLREFYYLRISTKPRRDYRGVCRRWRIFIATMTYAASTVSTRDSYFTAGGRTGGGSFRFRAGCL